MNLRIPLLVLVLVIMISSVFAYNYHYDKSYNTEKLKHSSYTIYKKGNHDKSHNPKEPIYIEESHESENSDDDKTIDPKNPEKPEKKEDITPPGPVTNLKATNIGKSTITWQWNNPSDTDFKEVIIFLDGVEVDRTSGTEYKAIDLEDDTKYTITIKTIDKNNNVNENGVSDTVETDSKSSNRKKEYSLYHPNNPKNEIFFEEIKPNRIILDEPEVLFDKNKKSDFDFRLFIVMLISFSIILILFIIILRVSQRK